MWGGDYGRNGNIQMGSQGVLLTCCYVFCIGGLLYSYISSGGISSDGHSNNNSNSNGDDDDDDDDKSKKLLHVPLAFFLTFLAGSCSIIGAAIPFYVSIQDVRYLAMALAFASGVMMYVSFVDIFPVSFDHFRQHFAKAEKDASCEAGRRQATIYSTFFFFVGMALITVIDVFLRNFMGYEEDDYEDIAKMILSPSSSTSISLRDGERKRLQKMGLATAIALGIHNLPEGISTFVTTLDNPNLGLTLAFAIALHNIPEGICVGFPVYFATKSRSQCLYWSAIAAAAEPLGAGMAYIFLQGRPLSHFAFGVVFALVSGIMVMLCIHDLLPAAFRLDPSNLYASNFVILGFSVMAMSLLLLL